jgi:hypothetical protein
MSSYVTSGIGGEPWVFVYPHVATSALPPRYSSQHSTRRGKYEKEKETSTQMAMYVCQLMIVEVTLCSHIGEFKRSTYFFLSPSIRLYLSSFLSHRFTFTVFRIFLKISLIDSCLWVSYIIYWFFREWHRTFEKTYWVSCQIKRRKSN